MDICFNRIDLSYSSICALIKQYTTDAFNKSGYKVYVRLYGLLEFSSLEASGVTKLRSNPNFDLRGQGVAIGFIFETTIINIYFQIIGSRSGAQLVIMRIQNPSEGIWKIEINKVNKPIDLRFNIWLPITGFINNETYFIKSSPYTTLTSPANVFIPMVVTAYDINNSLYIDASRGYIEYLDGTDIKSLLIRSAKREPNIAYPNREWGFGIVDIKKTFESLRGSI